MNDRELLELAAKAAEVELVCKQLINNGKEVDCYFQVFKDNVIGCWNPLEDDGDALRLAVTLAAMVDQQSDGVFVCMNASYAYADEPYRNDKFGATRRAIVRAAAEIGKAME